MSKAKAALQRPLLFMPASNLRQPLRHRLASRDHVQQQPLLHLRMTFVLGEVAQFVRLGQYAPHFRAEAQRVRQRLEHDEAVARTESVATQGSKAQRVRGVVGEVET